MEYSTGDLADRLTILQLKIEKNNDTRWKEEYAAVAKAYWAKVWSSVGKELSYRVAQNLLTQLREANEQIWDLEDDIREGREGKIGLEEVGRRAIALRDINRERVRIKNEFNRLTGSGYQETKTTFKD